MDKKYFFILLIFFVFSISEVSGFGITPGRTSIDYSPGKIETYSFEVLNTDKEDVEVVVLVQGELNASVSVSDVSFKMSASDESKRLEYKLIMPDNLKPGLHTAEVVALKLPGKSENSDAFIGSAVGVITQIFVYVPFPGKYIESSINIVNGGDGDMKFAFPLISRGKLDVVRAKVILDIYSSLNEKITSLTSQETSLKSGDRGELVISWEIKGIVPGKYNAIATLVYDEETETLEKEFSIGNQVLEVKNIEVNDFTLGGIAKFEILVENKWSESIDGAYLQMQIFNDEEEVMADFKSATYDFEPLKSKLMTAFWDTDGVRKGVYDSSLFLKFGAQSSRQDLKLDVKDSEINVVGLGYVISESGKGGPNTLVVVLVTLIVVLILVNLSWFLFLRRKISKKKK